MAFEEGLAFARYLKLTKKSEWREWSKTGQRPPNVPASPDDVYRHTGWQGWPHWLGLDTGGATPAATAAEPRARPKPPLPYGEARAFAHSLKLASSEEWWDWCMTGERPANIPSNPIDAYRRSGWQGWPHWLGAAANVPANAPANAPAKATAKGPAKGPAKSAFLPFGEAQGFASKLSLATKGEWLAWCRSGKRPANVPATPEDTYAQAGWQGYGHWLGRANGRGAKAFLPAKDPGSLVYLTFDEGRAIACTCRQTWQLCRHAAAGYSPAPTIPAAPQPPPPHSPTAPQPPQPHSPHSPHVRTLRPPTTHPCDPLLWPNWLRSAPRHAPRRCRVRWAAD